MAQHSAPLACNLSVWQTTLRGEEPRHQRVARELFRRLEQVRPLEQGLAFRLAANVQTLALAGEFIARERLCCPSLRFVLRLEPCESSFWCEVTGPEGTAEFLSGALRSNKGCEQFCVRLRD